MDNKVTRGKTQESLKNSRQVRANFLFRLGINEVPNSILYHDRSDKAMDLLVTNGRSYGDSSRDMVSRNTPDRYMRETFSISGQMCRGKGAALSRFPQNIGRLFVKFFCPQNGIVYDPFAGHNSRMQLTSESERNYIGCDISHEFMLANHKIKTILEKKSRLGLFNKNQYTIQLIEGSSNQVNLKDNLADFTLTSPPYWNLEYYGDEPEQLGNAKTYEKFLELLFEHVKENFRILKPGSYCVWFINDFAINKVFYSYHCDIVTLFKQAGFEIHNIYISLIWDILLLTLLLKQLLNQNVFPNVMNIV